MLKPNETRDMALYSMALECSTKKFNIPCFIIVSFIAAIFTSGFPFRPAAILILRGYERCQRTLTCAGKQNCIEQLSKQWQGGALQSSMPRIMSVFYVCENELYAWHKSLAKEDELKVCMEHKRTHHAPILSLVQY